MPPGGAPHAQGTLRRRRTFAPALPCALAFVVVTACGEDSPRGAGEERAQPAAPVVVPSSPGRPPTAGGLAIGLTEPNPHLLWSPRARARAPAGFSPWRERLGALRPAYWRLAVYWPHVQPRAGVAPDWDRPVDGCMRGSPPCAPFAGVRDQLRAVASRQRDGAGFEVAVLIYGAPDSAARPASGCERAGTSPAARPIASRALPAYRALVRSLLGLARREGVALPHWSPWNEPNHPTFISPQRARCDADAPALAPAVYATLVRALAAELRAAPGDQRIVLGELAGFAGPRPHGAGISEFVAALPADVLCAGGVWGQHAYPRRGPAAAAAGPVGELERALDRRGPCGRRARIWVTETGAGAPHAGELRQAGARELRASCRAMAASLRRWSRDPRVDAAFQYTFREDTAFPVGLADARLSRLYPTYDLWRAWGGTRSPGDPPPSLPRSCARD